MTALDAAVGDEVPILTRSTGGVLTGETATNVVSEVEYRDTGVILDIIPRVNASSLVTLDIIQEVSDAAPTPSTGATSVQTAAPTIQQRKTPAPWRCTAAI